MIENIIKTSLKHGGERRNYYEPFLLSPKCFNPFTHIAQTTFKNIVTQGEIAQN